MLTFMYAMLIFQVLHQTTLSGVIESKKAFIESTERIKNEREVT